MAMTAARRFFCATRRGGLHLPGMPKTGASRTSPLPHCSPGLSQDFKLSFSSSPRRLRGAFGMGESLMPRHSATAAASLVSKLCNGDTPLEGRLEGYLSPI
eukprot:c18324_g1_i1 orf=493-795(-)